MSKSAPSEPEKIVDELVMRLRLGHIYEDEAKARLLALIDEARIDELEHIILEGDMSAYRHIKDEMKRIKDRLTQLKGQHHGK